MVTRSSPLLPITLPVFCVSDKDELLGMVGAEAVCRNKLQGAAAILHLREAACAPQPSLPEHHMTHQHPSRVAIFKCTSHAMLFYDVASLTDHFKLDGLIRLIKRMSLSVDVFAPINTDVIFVKFMCFCRWHAWMLQHFIMKMLLGKNAKKKINFL